MITWALYEVRGYITSRSEGKSSRRVNSHPDDFRIAKPVYVVGWVGGNVAESNIDFDPQSPVMLDQFSDT